MAEWVKKGYFLDLEDIPPQYRPDSNYRFFLVKKQRLTDIRDISETIDAKDVVDIRIRNLKTSNKSILIQCAYGIYPNVRCYLEHPVDYSVGKLPKVLPSEGYNVGIITQEDSPYENPNLEKTEFWIIDGLADEPIIHVFNPYDEPLKVYIRILANVLIVEPVVDKDAIFQLERRIKPSTPVFLRVI